MQAFFAELQQIRGACEMELDNIEMKKEIVISGQRKQYLVDQWLRKIDTRVDDLLTRQYVSSILLFCKG